MFAARQSLNLFQKRAFSASASQVRAVPQLGAFTEKELSQMSYLEASLLTFLLNDRPPRSPSSVLVVELASPSPSS